MARRVLFVCTGNMCRSPMAEGMFREMLRRNGLAEAWETSSAGTGTMYGEPATSETINVMRERGIDLSRHASRPVSPDLAAAHDLILVMEAHHKSRIVGGIPSVASRTFTLGEYAGTGEGVPDPYGESRATYEKCAARIDFLLKKALARIAEGT